MRIIAGRLKGRRLSAPKGRAVRPTSDSLRETLFNVLGSFVVDARVLDAFAGTGALGIEAWSRGARHVTFVERDPAAVKTLVANLSALGLMAEEPHPQPDQQDTCAIIRGDFLSARATGAPFDLILLDPPYDIAQLESVVERGAACASADGRLVLEHSRRRESPSAAGSFGRTRVLVAGDSALSFYQRS
jgi:16S rRNA (guanine966-N2)-methyltransferase